MKMIICPNHLMICIVVCVTVFAGDPPFADGADVAVVGTSKPIRFKDITYCDDIVKNADMMIRQNQGKKAVQYLENKRNEYVQDLATNFQDVYANEHVLIRLYLQMGYAKNSAGAPKGEIVETFQKVLEESATNYVNEQGAAMIWLCENLPPKEYREIVRSYMMRNKKESLSFFLKVAKRLAYREGPTSIDLLIKHCDGVVSEIEDPELFLWGLDSYLKGKVDAQYKVISHFRGRSELTFYSLTKDCGSITEKIVTGETKQAGLLCRDLIKRCGSDRDKTAYKIIALQQLIWIANEYKKNKDLLRANAVYQEVGKVCDQDENIDIVRIKDLAAKGLKNLAQTYINQKNYKKAIEIYGELGEDSEKAKWELEACKCLQLNGDYEATIARLDEFISQAKGHKSILRRNLVPQAMLLKGQCLLQMGLMDEATDTFLFLITEYPNWTQASDAAFFIGYSKMLQGNFTEAKDGFTLVMTEYPASQYVAKARQFLERIDKMAK